MTALLHGGQGQQALALMCPAVGAYLRVDFSRICALMSRLAIAHGSALRAEASNRGLQGGYLCSQGHRRDNRTRDGYLYDITVHFGSWVAKCQGDLAGFERQLTKPSKVIIEVITARGTAFTTFMSILTLKRTGCSLL